MQVYYLGKASATNIKIDTDDVKAQRKIDILTTGSKNTDISEILVKNRSPYKQTLFQDSIVGTVSEPPAKPPEKSYNEATELEHWEDIKKIDINEELTEREKSEVYKLLNEFHDVFIWENEKLVGGLAKTPKIKIELEEQKLVYKPPYPLSPAETSWLQAKIQELKELKILEESRSPFGSPAMLVRKDVNSYRLVQDYRQLNTFAKKVRYPLPNLESCLSSISSSKYVTKLDCSNGYWQLPLHEDSRELTAFGCVVGHFHHLVMPMGFCNSAAEFQWFIDRMLSGLKYVYVIPYLDDMYSIGDNFENMLRALRLNLERVREHRIKLGYKKCQVASRRMGLFGYLLTEKGLECNPEKVQAIRDYTTPRNITEVRRWLGLVSYYRRFIKNASLISRSLHDLVKEKATPFVWNEEVNEAFLTLKSILTSAPVLVAFDPTKELEICVDSCTYGVGAVLGQYMDPKTVKPICYYSALFTKAEINYSTTAQELLGVLKACKRFRCFITGRRTTVITDHKALKQCSKIKNDTHTLARLALKLVDYDLEIVYKKGRLHMNADALSRAIPGAGQCNLIETIDLSELAQQQRSDEEFAPIFEAVQDPEKVTSLIRRKSRQFFIADNGWLYKKTYGQNGVDRLLCIPKVMRPVILKSFHCEIESAHPGVFKTT